MVFLVPPRVTECSQRTKFHSVRLMEVNSCRIQLSLAELTRGGSYQAAILEIGPKQQKMDMKRFRVTTATVGT